MKNVLYVAISAITLNAGCSSGKDPINKRSVTAEESIGDSNVEKSSGDSSSPVLPQSTSDGFLLGVADSCTPYKADSGESCFECMPRKFPLNHCMKAPEGFDPNTQCRFNSLQMICKIGEEESTMSLKESSFEKIIPQLPVMISFGKQYVAQRDNIADDERRALNMGIDFVRDHALDIIVGKNLPEKAKMYAQLVKATFPEVVTDEAALKAIEDKALANFSKLDSERKHGRLDQLAVIFLGTDLMETLPDGLKSRFKQIDFTSLKALAEQYRGKEDALVAILSKSVGAAFGANLRMRLNLVEPSAK